MQIHQLMDAGLFALSFWLAYQLRSNAEIIEVLHLDPLASPFNSYKWLLLILVVMAPLILEAQGFYRRPIVSSRRATAWPLFKGCLFTTLGVVLALFFFKTEIARWVPLWFGLISFLIVFLKEEVLRFLVQGRLGQLQYRRRFILVGTDVETAQMRADLRSKSQEGIDVLEELNLNDAPLSRLVELLHEHSVNGVILNTRHTDFEQAESVIRACELEGVEIWLVAEFFKTQISRTSFDDFYGRPVMVFRTTPEASWQSASKKFIDFFGAIALLIVSGPILLLVGILVRMTSPGPILFRQQRSGLNGRPFTIYKFRTMVTNAEQLKHELASMNEMHGPVFKVTHDPRITPIGRILRKFSLDEFPQLLNVIRGEMSLVGPRPLPVDEVRRFDDLAHRRRLSVKPGLTCLWQISGRNNVTDFKEWVRLDLEYIDNWSLWLDIKILWRTVPIVLVGTGAK
jgi:exopolysaccharide biosynthesis polyprenyl glycosylphosphotransferase